MTMRFVSFLVACSSVFVMAFSLHEVALKEYTVSKVVKLLEDMRSQLQKEADADEEVYDNLACWCETNDKAKTKAIADAETRLTELASSIESLTAQSEQLVIDIAGLKTEIARNEKALETATGIRKKQAEQFTEEEKEMLESIRALGAAIVVLSKHHSGAALTSVMATVSAQMQKHGDLLKGSITPREKRAIMSFAQETGADNQPTFKPYKPESGEIFGILSQMKETFEADLSEDQKEELSNQEQFVELKKAKDLEISTAKSVLEEKTELLATTNGNIAQAKEDEEDTTASLSADEKFLMELKQKCSQTDQEWETRQKTRQQEMDAVSKAISILHSDDARDLFSKVFNPSESFFQERRLVNVQAGRQRAAERLSVLAARYRSPKLAALALNLRIDAFEKVKKAIDDMVKDLKAEKAEEITHKDNCISGLAELERNTALKTHSKEDAEAKISGFKAKIAQLDSEIGTLNAEITELDQELTKAATNRAAETKEFEGVVADQIETQQLLQQALTVLEAEYKDDGSQLLQKQQKQTHGRSSQAPPPGFTAYEKSGAANSVLVLLQHIIDSAKQMEQEARDAEQKAVEAHNLLKQTIGESKIAKQSSIDDKKSTKATTEQSLLQKEADHSGLLETLEQLSKSTADMHTSCDYTLKNFDLRQEARDQEIEALQQAKAYLSGMDMTSV